MLKRCAPTLGVIGCVVFMMGPILLDIISKATGVDLIGIVFGQRNDSGVDRDPAALWILSGYAVVGVLIYAFFGHRNSKLSHPPAAAE